MLDSYESYSEREESMRATQVANGEKAPPENPHQKIGPTPPKSERLAKKRARFQKRAAIEEKRQIEEVASRPGAPLNRGRKKPRPL